MVKLSCIKLDNYGVKNIWKPIQSRLHSSCAIKDCEIANEYSRVKLSQIVVKETRIIHKLADLLPQKPHKKPTRETSMFHEVGLAAEVSALRLAAWRRIASLGSDIACWRHHHDHNISDRFVHTAHALPPNA